MGSISFTVEIPGTSPVVHYYPFAETYAAADLLAGWAPWYSNSGYQTEAGMRGNGTPFHVTAQEGAQFAIDFEGGNLSLYGAIVDATYDVKLDDVIVPSTFKDGLLAQIENVPRGKHRVIFTAHPSSTGKVFFERALLNVTTGLELAHVLYASNESAVLDNHTTGIWTITPDPGFNKTFLITRSEGAAVSVPLSGASAVAINGLRNIDHGLYNVTLDAVTTQFDAKSGFKTATLLYFNSNLDPSINHQLTITNAANGSVLAIESINVTYVAGGHATYSMSPNTLPIGTILALSIAGVAGFCILLGLVYWRWIILSRRNKRKRKSMVDGASGNPKVSLLPFTSRNIRQSEDDVDPQFSPRESWRRSGAKSQGHRLSYEDSIDLLDTVHPNSDYDYVLVSPPARPFLPLREPTPFIVDFSTIAREESLHQHPRSDSNGAQSTFLSFTDSPARSITHDDPSPAAPVGPRASIQILEPTLPDRSRRGTKDSSRRLSLATLGARNNSRRVSQEEPLSPTDSIPITLSTIHFHSHEGSGSAEADAPRSPSATIDGSHSITPPSTRDHPPADSTVPSPSSINHLSIPPPLPESLLAHFRTPRAVTNPHIMQLLGRTTPSQTSIHPPDS